MGRKKKETIYILIKNDSYYVNMGTLECLENDIIAIESDGDSVDLYEVKKKCKASIYIEIEECEDGEI